MAFRCYPVFLSGFWSPPFFHFCKISFKKYQNYSLAFLLSVFFRIGFLFINLPITVRAFAKPGTFDRNASAYPNITQNRNLSNVLRYPGFANALLAAALLVCPLCGGAGILFCKLGFEHGFVRLANVYDCVGLAYTLSTNFNCIPFSVTFSIFTLTILP